MFKTLAATCLLLCACDTYRILVVSPIPSRSHNILGDGIVRNLLKAGHEVTRIMAIPSINPHKNLTQVHAISNFKVFNENSFNIKAILDKELNLKDFDMVQELMFNISSSTMHDENVQKLLQDPTQQFDVVIAEWMFSELYSTMAAVYGCPFIWFSTLEPHWQITRLIDEPLNPAYSTDCRSSASTPPYSFLERVEELWLQVTGLLRKYRYLVKEKNVYQNTIVPILQARGKGVPPYEDLVANISMVLGNSHVSMGLAQRLPQSYKPIGGFHIDQEQNSLPDDLQNLLDNSEHGVIYFSLGSNLKSKDIPQSMKSGFLKVFSGLKQTVLWKFEEILPDMPMNVHILTWAPQQSILAHPNCILFITHGGQLSITEAVHFGKPIIGIPVFADQFKNVQNVVAKGFGKIVDLSYSMVDELGIQIEEMLRNPKYAQKAKEWSFIYHDRPTTAGQEVVHWTEHVIKTAGAMHLRSPALLLPWYQKMYLDLIALVLAAAILVVGILKIVLRRFMIKIVHKKKKTQ